MCRQGVTRVVPNRDLMDLIEQQENDSNSC